MPLILGIWEDARPLSWDKVRDGKRLDRRFEWGKQSLYECSG